MAYITEQNAMKMKLEKGKILNESSLIKGIIDKHKQSSFYKEAISARDYYNDRHDILNKNFQKFMVKGVAKYNLNAANNRIPNEFFTELIDQKVDYVAGNPPKFTAEDKDTEAVLFADKLNFEFKTYLRVDLIRWLAGSSVSGKDAMLIYINEKGAFDYTIVPGEQLIFDRDENRNIISLMRFYYVDYQNEKGLVEDIIRVEIWDERETWFYIQSKKDGDFILDISEPVNPLPHFFIGNTSNKDETQGNSWGEIPFIFLPNNINEKSDLSRIKTLIDSYDLLISKGINNIQDIQEVVYVLRGYDGTDLDTFMETLKINKAIRVDAEGGADVIKAEIPVQAITEFEKLLRKNIYAFGRGVDFSDESFAGDASGISLKYKFARLDLKANQIIAQLELAILNLIRFYAKYLLIKTNQDYTKIYENINFKISKRMIINEAEMITNVQSSLGILSNRTILENHPYVHDVDKELERKKEEEVLTPNINFDTVNNVN